MGISFNLFYKELLGYTAILGPCAVAINDVRQEAFGGGYCRYRLEDRRN